MPPDAGRPSVAIVGAGAVGTALGHALSLAGVRVIAVASRTGAHAEALARALRGAAAVPIERASADVDIVLLAVSDSAIEDACAALDARAGVLVAHTSGSRDVGALERARAAGALVGGLHPLAAVVRRMEPAAATPAEWMETFQGAAFAIEGDAPVRALLWPLATALGGHPFGIAAADKARYHLGASMTAAFAAGLAQVAWDGMRAAGASDDVASAGVGHLLETVARNITTAPSPAAALTGPVARGDAGGVRRQAQAAAELSPAAYGLYLAHVRHNIDIAHRAGRIDAARAVALTHALDEIAALPAPNDHR